jgi:hypothetical protein
MLHQDGDIDEKMELLTRLRAAGARDLSLATPLDELRRRADRGDKREAEEGEGAEGARGELLFETLVTVGGAPRPLRYHEHDAAVDVARRFAAAHGAHPHAERNAADPVSAPATQRLRGVRRQR